MLLIKNIFLYVPASGVEKKTDIYEQERTKDMCFFTVSDPAIMSVARVYGAGSFVAHSVCDTLQFSFGA